MPQGSYALFVDIYYADFIKNRVIVSPGKCIVIIQQKIIDSELQDSQKRARYRKVVQQTGT